MRWKIWAQTAKLEKHCIKRVYFQLIKKYFSLSFPFVSNSFVLSHSMSYFPLFNCCNITEPWLGICTRKKYIVRSKYDSLLFDAHNVYTYSSVLNELCRNLNFYLLPLLRADIFVIIHKNDKTQRRIQEFSKRRGTDVLIENRVIISLLSNPVAEGET